MTFPKPSVYAWGMKEGLVSKPHLWGFNSASCFSPQALNAWARENPMMNQVATLYYHLA